MGLITSLSFILPGIIDMLVTVLGQPAEYWNTFSAVREGSPGGQLLLSVHPIAFIAVFMVYAAIVFLILRKWKNAFTFILGLVFFVGHAWGSSSWIPVILQRYDWYYFIIYFIIVSIPLGIALHRENH